MTKTTIPLGAAHTYIPPGLPLSEVRTTLIPVVECYGEVMGVECRLNGRAKSKKNCALPAMF